MVFESSSHRCFGLHIKTNAVYQLIMLVSLTGALHCFLIGDPTGNSPEVKQGIPQESLPNVSSSLMFRPNFFTKFTSCTVGNALNEVTHL